MSVYKECRKYMDIEQKCIRIYGDEKFHVLSFWKCLYTTVNEQYKVALGTRESIPFKNGIERKKTHSTFVEFIWLK